MKAIVYPSRCQNEVHIPPSKSMSHRAIICACLAKGKSIIRNLAFSEDIKITIAGMRQLGATITEFSDYVEIQGISEISKIENPEVYCKESGSTLRFFIPIFSLTNQAICFKGEERLMKRPQTVYQTIFEHKRLPFLQTDEGITINGGLQAGKYELDGNVSSQFITGLLFALSMLRETSVIHIKPPFESRSYVNLTLQAMADFGVIASFIDDNTIEIKGGQAYQPCDYTVEGDYSQLAFFAVLGAINHDLKCVGVRHDSLQGDRVIIDILKQSGVQVDAIENGYMIHKSHIHATDIDLSDCPDLGPILTVLAMFAEGTTRIYNAGRLRLKESDRIEAMETELKKLGCNINSTQDEIIIQGNQEYIPLCDAFAHNDHRIAMSLAVAATRCQSPVVIDDAQSINKSYPSFFEDLKRTGVRVDIQE